MRRRRLVAARLRAESDVQPVPAVDRHDGQRQVHQFLFAELRPRLLVHFIGDVPLCDERHGLGPRKRRSLALRVEGRLAPSVEQVEPLLGLARGPQVLRVHVEAVGAAVDLRHAEIQEVEQRLLQPGLRRYAPSPNIAFNAPCATSMWLILCFMAYSFQ